MSTLLNSTGHRLKRLFSVSPYLIWSLNWLAAISFLAWLYIDPRFEASMKWWQFQNHENAHASEIRNMGDWWWLAFRNRSVTALVAFALTSCILIFGCVFFGKPKQRTVRTWLLAVSIVAIWLGILVSWKDVAWAGKQRRIGMILAQFDPVVKDLRNQWPERDGERPVIGPFMAYPVGAPASLILLKLPQFEGTDTSCAVIEKGVGIFRFELVGAEHGDWLEWHPSGSSPANFISGLMEPYELVQSQRLTQNWHLVRYQ